MNILTQAKLMMDVIGDLSNFNPRLVIASTGSCYIHLTGSKVRCIRIANHKGHKESKCYWQLRTDVCSSRKGMVRIYNDAARLIADLI